MNGRESDRDRTAPGALTATAVADFRVDRFDSDSSCVAIPRPEIQIVIRFGRVGEGIDVHALGTQRVAHRKHIARGQWAIAARLRLGASRQVLGVAASALVGSAVPLEEFWGREEVQRLLSRLLGASESAEAVKILDGALAERLMRKGTRDSLTPVAARAAEKLGSAKVSAVALELGLSERQLRRVFRDAVGMAPKEFARIIRFRRALTLARESNRSNWANVAADAGYYDQSHLIDEFRSIGGATPQQLLGEARIF